MNKLDIAKMTVNLIVGIGVAKIVGGIVNTNVPINTRLDRVFVGIGRVALVSVANEVVEQHVNRKIDEGVAWVAANSNKSD